MTTAVAAMCVSFITVLNVGSLSPCVKPPTYTKSACAWWPRDTDSKLRALVGKGGGDAGCPCGVPSRPETCVMAKGVFGCAPACRPLPPPASVRARKLHSVPKPYIAGGSRGLRAAASGQASTAGGLRGGPAARSPATPRGGLAPKLLAGREEGKRHSNRTQICHSIIGAAPCGVPECSDAEKKPPGGA